MAMGNRKGEGDLPCPRAPSFPVPGQSALPTLSGLKRLRKKRMVWVLVIEKLWDLEV